MPDAAQIWKDCLPEIKRGVTGVGVWTALNAAKPLALEDGVLVIGLPHQDSDLSGHLRMPATRRMIETNIAGQINAPITLRVIEGVTAEDWETAKRRDVEARRLQAQQMTKMRAELAAKSSWDSIFEQLSRRYAAVSNKSLPQNRARFYEEAIELIAETRKSQTNWDELGERNFARCLERLAQYSEVPSTLVARDVLRQSGEL